MMIKLKQLRSLVKEAFDAHAAGPTIGWPQWLDQFDQAVISAGYNTKSDLPAYDFIGSEGDDAGKIDQEIHKLWKSGLSPEDALSITLNRDKFLKSAL